MAKKGLTSLADFDTAEVSLVDRGANKKKPFPVFKKENPMDPKLVEILKSVMAEEIEDEAALDAWIEKAKLGDKEAAAIKAAMRILSAFKESPPIKKVVDGMSAMVAGDKAEDEEGDDDKDPKKPFPGAAEPFKTKKAADAQPKEDEVTEPKIPEDVQKRLDAADARAEASDAKVVELKKSLDDEKRARELGDLKAECKEKYDLVPGLSVEEMAKTLQSATPEMRESIEKQWAATQEAMASSDLLKSAGGSGSSMDGGDAYQKLDAIAKSYIEKGGEELSYEMAFDRAVEKNPALYNQYIRENPAQTARTN
jgi:hypothetical protein